MPGMLSQLSLLTDSQTQAAIYFVVGIIVIEGIWLTYLTWMMWKRQRHRKEKPPAEEKQEAPSQEKNE